MEARAQVPALSSSSNENDEGYSETRWLSPRKVPKHSTPKEKEEEEEEVEEEEEDDVEVPSQSGGPLPGFSSQDHRSPQTGLWPTATLPRRRLSTIRASRSEGPSGQLGSDSGPWASGEDPPMPALVTSGQQGKHPPKKSQTRSQRISGIRDRVGKRRRDRKKLAAVVERVRQWEYRLMQDIEEATQHELTIEPE